MQAPTRSNCRIAQLLAVLVFAGAVAPAWAGMVGTDRVLERAGAEAARAELIALVERDAVREQLRARGVSPERAKARVARMTDTEVVQLQGRIEEARAGGDVLGAVLVVFVVFVITDAVGATDVFPFVHPVN